MADNSSFHNLHQHTCQSDSGATVDLDEKSCGQVGGKRDGQRKVKTVQQVPIDENKENAFTGPEQKLPEEGPDNENPDHSDCVNGRTEPGCAGNSSSDDHLEITDENVQNDTDTVSTDEHQFYSESAECDTSECTKSDLQNREKVDEEEKTDLTGDQRTHSSNKNGPNFKGTDEKQSDVDKDESVEVKKEIYNTVRSENEIQGTEGNTNMNTALISLLFIMAATTINANKIVLIFKVLLSLFRQIFFIFFAVYRLMNTTKKHDENSILKPLVALHHINDKFIREVLVVGAVVSLHELPDLNLPDLDLPDQDLPDPDLPVILDIHVGQHVRGQHGPPPRFLGVNMRDMEHHAIISGQDGELGSNVPLPVDSGPLGTRERRIVQQRPVNQCSADEINDGGEIVHLQYPALIQPSGEVNGSTDGVTGRRTWDVPNLQTSCITDIALNEEQTETKVGNFEEHLNTPGRTSLTQDGNPTTVGNRRDMQPTDNHSPDANVVLEIASQLSTSITEQAMFPASPPTSATPATPATPATQTAECLFTYPGSMDNVQARANTFNPQWPHTHLSHRKMAMAGLYFTDDNPFVEHLRHSPGCDYIRNILQSSPQNFGACCGNGEAQLDEVLESYESEDTDVQPEIYRYTLCEGYNGQQRLQMVVTNTDNEQVERPRRPNLHGEQDQNVYERNHSEAIEAFAGTEDYQHEESTGIQESGYQSSSTYLSARLHEHNYQSAEVHNGVARIGTDKALLNYYLGTEEVGMVFSEGYSSGDISQAVEEILRDGRQVTLNLLRKKLREMGARWQN